MFRRADSKLIQKELRLYYNIVICARAGIEAAGFLSLKMTRRDQDRLRLFGD
jgi:hypothetical protein